MAPMTDSVVIGALGPDVPVNLIRSHGAEPVDVLDLHWATAPHDDDARQRAQDAMGAAADKDSVDALALLIRPDCPVSVVVISSTYQSHLWLHQVLQQWRQDDPHLPEPMLIDLKHGGRPSTLRYNIAQLKKLGARLLEVTHDVDARSRIYLSRLADEPAAPNTTPLVLSGSRVRDPKLRKVALDQGYSIVAEDHGEDFWASVAVDGSDASITHAAGAHAFRAPLAPTASPRQRAQELIRILRRQTSAKPGHVLFCTRTHDDATLWDRSRAIHMLKSSGLPWTWSSWHYSDAADSAGQIASLRAALPRLENQT